MKFWKLQTNGNDFLLYHRNKKMPSGKSLCNYQSGAGSNGYIQVWKYKGVLHCEVYAHDGKLSNYFYDGLRCCASWFFQQQHCKRCTIYAREKAYRLKGCQNLITLEWEPEEESFAQEGVNYFNAIRFMVQPLNQRSDAFAHLCAYFYGYQQGLLHKMAIGKDGVGVNFLQYSYGRVYISAPVQCIYEAKIEEIS